MSTSSPEARADIGVTGLAVMGRNLARNFARKGHTVALHNRTQSRVDDLVKEFGDEGDFVPSTSLEEFVGSLKTPRTIVIMVKAGAGTDAVIDELTPLLDEGDILVDGGNAHFEDTRRREKDLREKGLNFVGAGISGGEVGALEGPSIMPGGSDEAYRTLGPILESAAAHVDGEPCCAHLGPDGAGHFVKMVHNGIEYADMQAIAEVYDVLSAAGFTAQEASDVFRRWNEGDLESFLVEITADVLAQVDAGTGRPLVELIRDEAEQKGTGRWTVQIALDLGVPAPVIGDAVFARSLSGDQELRGATGGVLVGPDRAMGDVDRDALVDDLGAALWCAKVMAYAQGLAMIRKASAEYDWDVDVATVARIWRDGCIIRARLLKQISDEYAGQNLPTLLVAPSIKDGLGERQEAWRRVVATAVTAGVPVPGLSGSLASYDTARATRLPAALVQGLRDDFGAHTYRRTDKEGSFHTLWSGDRSEVSAD
ncbi:NADP-dependent phosphogluconate dehydrogenase [Lapillicoccus jejuensis]|uniref:6-phosphogluconate dehydrogenase, decarboxylating n=1 Tax=Lapillicoccus jejuensis TaxID=402171 RepID=A0A542E062_9MICO|nr:NADP-dependent phosphogluconate dehydrogenase [Lapillicoccus jejuensis]TQJ08696.1 6-phosphogluconate dehydrogenase [Lapillicoccus jejuensis]